jgi:hypothetical protein
MRGLVLISLPLLVCIAAFTEPDQRTTKCEWPPETAIPLDLRNAEQYRHLSRDAELAEDLAIRYADSGNWKVPGQTTSDDYVRSREKCMATLFSIIAENHGVNEEQVREALKQRPVVFDFAVLLTFAAFYFFIAYQLARRICHRFPLSEGWSTALVTTTGAAILVSIGGILALDILALAAEIIRLGNDHISYRDNRIPWYYIRIELFVGGLFLFWLAAALRYRAANRIAEVSGD